jgi:hypothetical protein
MAWLRTYWQDQYLPRLRLHFGDRVEICKCLLLVTLIALFCLFAVDLLGAA